MAAMRILRQTEFPISLALGWGDDIPVVSRVVGALPTDETMTPAVFLLIRDICRHVVQPTENVPA